MEKLMTIEQLADYLGIAVSTIYQWKHEEYIPHVKLRSALRFRVSTIDKWIAKQEVGGRSKRKIDTKEIGL